MSKLIEHNGELVAVRRFNREVGIVGSTFWRWRQRKWIGEPLNIGGRLYLSAEQIAEFKRRAAAGEFSASIKPPARRVESRRCRNDPETLHEKLVQTKGTAKRK